MDKDIEILETKLEYFEATLKQLNDEMPGYFEKRMSDEFIRLSGILRAIASLEGDSATQKALFLTAQNIENIHNEKSIFKKAKNYSNMSLDTAKDKMLNPLQSVMDEVKKTQQNLSSKRASEEEKEEYKNYSRRVVPLYSMLFEKHRLKNMKKYMTALISAELRYHCRVVEELSEALVSISSLPEYE